MKRFNWKIILLIMLALIAVFVLTGCAAYYKPAEDSHWIIQVW